MRRDVPLLPLTPREQLSAGLLPRRVVQLLAGLVLYGVSVAMLVRAELGLEPWGVLAQGVSERLGWSFGMTTNAIGAAVLLLWVPLRQWPGLGTVLNVLVIGTTADLVLHVLHRPELPGRAALLVGGVLLNGIGGAMYIGSQLGPGPRDGLMTGLAHRTGRSVRLVRTGLEVVVLAAGWALGGTVGLGTVLYAVAIGHVVQHFLPRLTVDLRPHRDHAAEAVPGAGAADATG